MLTQTLSMATTTDRRAYECHGNLSLVESWLYLNKLINRHKDHIKFGL